MWAGNMVSKFGAPGSDLDISNSASESWGSRGQDVEGWVTVWELDNVVRDLDLGFGGLDVGIEGLNLRIWGSSARKLSPF